MQHLLGHDPPGFLRKTLRSPISTNAHSFTRYIVHLLKNYPVNGSNAITVAKIRETVVVLVGEVHENEGLCASPMYDVLKHIVLKAIRKVPGTFLLVEGFPCSISDDVPTLLRSIREKFYLEMLRCLRGSDAACQYGGVNRGNLAILRTLKLVVHAARLCYPGDSNVQEMDDQIHFFDIRRNLGMQSPFTPWEGLSPHEIIRNSLKQIKDIRGFLNTIPHAEWQRNFHENVLVPFLQEASRICEKPSVSRYTQFFIKISDVVAVNQILYRSAANSRDGIIILYAGDNHRLGVLTLLRRVLTVNILAESKDSRENGSCSAPI